MVSIMQAVVAAANLILLLRVGLLTPRPTANLKNQGLFCRGYHTLADLFQFLGAGDSPSPSFVGYITPILVHASSMKPGRMIIYMEDERPIIIPRSRRTGPLGYKFYTHLPKINKEPSSKYVNYTPVRFKLLPYLVEDSFGEFNDGIIKKCCGNEWVDVKQEVPYYRLPEHLPSTTSHLRGYHEQVQHYLPSKSEDIKPVTEDIEDDLKYDFRTKTHSFR